MNGIAAVLLAAGESQRMGAINKLSLPVGGKALLRRSAEILLGSAVSKIVVVMGHRAETAEGLLSGLSLQTVRNPRYREGQMTSVHVGLEALTGAFDGVMICLADQPLLESVDIDRLIDAYLRDPGCSVLVPVHQGQRGNPVILDYAHRAAILGSGRDLGCRRFIDRNPDLVTRLDVDSNHYTFDLDTPDDYAALDGDHESQRPGPVFDRPVTGED